MKKYYSIDLNDEEREMIANAMELGGFRTKAELIRFLIREYMAEYYQGDK